MCGGDICDCGYNIATILYVSERLASCCAAMAVVVCLVATLITMLAMGVGLGYNYCVVDQKIGVKNPLGGKENQDNLLPESDKKAVSNLNTHDMTGIESVPSTEDGSIQSLHRHRRKQARKRSIDSKVKIPQHNSLDSSEFSTLIPLTTLSSEHLEIKPTMLVPLRIYNLSSLIERLRKYNKNVTLEILQ